MKFSVEEIKHIADLSRLEIAATELEMYRGYFRSILDYVDKLAEAETTNVPEMATVSYQANAWRADEGRPADPSERAAAINSFPRRQGSLLEVPAVFEGRTE
jgi:aspartyl-tRNA(Asn)/glutamyl-tRNA(Gln) amidotransferase subunit C